MVPLLLLLFFLPASLYLAGAVSQSSQAGIKGTLFASLHRISYAQHQVRAMPQRCLLFVSLICCLFSIILLPFFAESLSQRSFSLIAGPDLVTSNFAPMLFLGLLLLLHVAGEVCLAITEQKRNAHAMLFLNSYFWLPALLAWAAVAYYLPLGNRQATTGAVSAMWLVLLQPLGSLALMLALIGPYLLSNTARAINPIQNWIREFRMLISLLIIVLTLIGSRTCFSPVETGNSPAEIIRLCMLPVMTLILLLIVVRLRNHFDARGGFVAESCWKLTLWLALTALTASFLAFHVLGMSDHLMHVLLNFSLLAIWAGFILPKYHLKPSATNQE